MNAHEPRAEALAVLREFEAALAHVLHVTRLALELFDGLAELHRLGDTERRWLEAAALLHDIGHRTAPGGRNHHKESARLIRGQAWRHFTAGEAELIAQIARYHRKAPPSLKHAEFAALSGPDRSRVQKLAALLRLADGFDRTHRQQVRRLRVQVAPGKIIFNLDTLAATLKEIAAANVKGDLARLVFGRELEFLIDGVPVKPAQKLAGLEGPAGSV